MGKNLFDNYNASEIEILEGLEPVRHRPGMYVGGTDSNAMHHLATEILDNSMDEVVAKHATTINVNLLDDNTISISDNGRGIPVDNHPKFKNKSALEIIMTTLHSGGKFTNKNYTTSGGLHGVGASVVNALSSFMKVEVIRDGYLYVQEFSRGLPISPLTKNDKVKKIMEHLLLLDLIMKYSVKIIFLNLLKSLICWKIKLSFLKESKSIGIAMKYF